MEIHDIMKKNVKQNNKNILKKEQIYYNNQNKFNYICPHCQQIITIENDILEDMILACPNCGQEGKIRALQKRQNINDTSLSNHIIENPTIIDERENINIPAIEVKILGIILIIIGIALFYFVNLFSIKITLMIIIIGVVIFTFIPNNRLIFIKFNQTKNKEQPKNELNTHNYSLINYIHNFLKNQFDISETRQNVYRSKSPTVDRTPLPAPIRGGGKGTQAA